MSVANLLCAPGIQVRVVSGTPYARTVIVMLQALRVMVLELLVARVVRYLVYLALAMHSYSMSVLT